MVNLIPGMFMFFSFMDGSHDYAYIYGKGWEFNIIIFPVLLMFILMIIFIYRLFKC